MESGYLFVKSVDLLGECKGSATDFVRGKYHNRRMPNHCILLSVGRQLREKEYFTECDGMMDIHIKFVMHVWKYPEAH
jgi:hypothetical protein